MGEGIKYAELKDSLAKAIYNELKPIQERREKFENDPELVEKILTEGANRARVVAEKTLEETKAAMGII